MYNKHMAIIHIVTIEQRTPVSEISRTALPLGDPLEGLAEPRSSYVHGYDSPQQKLCSKVSKGRGTWSEVCRGPGTRLQESSPS